MRPHITAKHLVHDMDKVKTKFIDNLTKWRLQKYVNTLLHV